MESHHHHQHGPAAETDPAATAAMAELLDLDAEVLHSYLSEVTGWIRELTADPPPRRILDLGSGTGTGTVALLERFGQAHAIAVDVSAELLHRLTGKAHALNLADRVRTVQADLDAAWPAVGVADLVWASSSLHHLADPDRVLTEVFAALRPGGLLVVAEMESFPRFLPDDLGLGRPGLEARCHQALEQDLAAQLPHLGSDWGARLSGAGFIVEAERSFVIELTPPLPASAGRYVQASLRRMRSGLDGRVSDGDLAVLDTLIDSDGPDGIRKREDLSVRTTRTVWMARRP
ncbi:MAG: methyltransferase domain-containing protein [Actinomycetota bacterium]|nr:methyltransferase domain-containing protein [Actinomycetota bacterium]